MTLPLSLRPEAEQDVGEAAAWYERQRHGLGATFLDELARTCARIIEQPKLYRVLHRNTRRALMHRFPFGVFYRLEKQQIIVIAVLHYRRSPDRWKQRPP